MEHGSSRRCKTSDYRGRFVPSVDPLLRALQVLYEAAIPAIVDESRTDASDGSKVMVIRVPLVLKSRIRLRRAGFHQDPRRRGIARSHIVQIAQGVDHRQIVQDDKEREASGQE